MPTYEYRCHSGHDFELFQRMSDEPGASCPECGEPAERILSGGAGFIFKGEGFYITDYRSDDYKKAAASDSADSSTGGDAKDSGKSSGSDKAKGKDAGKDTGASSSAKPSSSDG